jgi:hypothetical protein
MDVVYALFVIGDGNAHIGHLGEDNMKKIKDFYEAWWYLYGHSAFTYIHPEYKVEWGSFQECLDIDVQKVNPKTNRIENDEDLNTKTVVWLECGEYIYDEHIKDFTPCHDIRLDCGGDTFEEAIIKLANLVKKHYK